MAARTRASTEEVNENTMQYNKPISFRTVCLTGALITATAFADDRRDWPQFRGPQGNGIASMESAPVEITQANTVWKTPMPGKGWSSPVHSQGHIWLTTAETAAASEAQLAKKRQGVDFAQMKTAAGHARFRAICIDARSGSIKHNIQLLDLKDPELIHALNSYASPTPAIQGDRVVFHFGSYGTWCLNLTTGEQLWKQTSLVVDHSVGPGSSPVIAKDTVLLVYDGIDEQFVAGVDLATGKPKWRTKRPPMRATNGEYRKAYSTPLIIDVAGQTQAVIPGAQWMCGYDPTSGKELWRADCGDGFSTTPMAVYDSGVVVCSTGFMQPQLVAVDPKGSGDVTDSIVWKSRNGGTTMPTAVAADGAIFSMDEKGRLTIVSSTTGEMLARARVGGNFSSSPLLAAGRLYVGSREGVLSVYALEKLDGKYREPKLLARNKLDGDLMASPAVLGSDFIIRTSKSLMRVTPEKP